MVDSGAYSAMTLGYSIRVEDYANFILDHVSWAKYKINLDVINPVSSGEGGAKARLVGKWRGLHFPTSPEGFEKAAAGSCKNFEYLRKRGVKGLVPVFHYGERLYWLEKYLEEADGLIGIAASSSPSQSIRFPWYGQIFEHAEKFRKTPMFHIFGDLTGPTIRSFPWYSADSTTAVQGAGFGSVQLFSDYGGFCQVNLGFFNQRGLSRTRGEDGAKPMLASHRAFSSLKEFPEHVQVAYAKAYEVGLDAFTRLRPKDEPDIYSDWRLRLLVSLASFAQTAEKVKDNLGVRLFTGTRLGSLTELADAAGIQYALVAFKSASKTQAWQRKWRELQLKFKE
jgi:hypothetical protein